VHQPLPEHGDAVLLGQEGYARVEYVTLGLTPDSPALLFTLYRQSYAVLSTSPDTVSFKAVPRYISTHVESPALRLSTMYATRGCEFRLVANHESAMLVSVLDTKLGPLVGVSGGAALADNVAAETVVHAPEPWAFVACTRTLYVLASLRPVMVYVRLRLGVNPLGTVYVPSPAMSTCNV
jgi:hypothetical protein